MKNPTPHQFDAQDVKADFPILGRTIYDQPLVYLDNAATTQKPVAVLDALDSFYTQHNANIHRGVHLLAEEATLLYEQARAKVGQFINAPSIEEVIFTSGTTESINLVASSWAMTNIKPGQKIVLTHMEHHANLLPWQRVAKNTGAQLVFIPITDQGYLVDNWQEYIDSSVAVVAFPHISNVLGTINPVKQMIATAHQAGARVLVDAAQSAPYADIDVQDWDADFVAFSGHKMMAPTGIGVLYAKKELLEAMEPYQLGGEMIKQVSYQSAQWNDPPWKFEAGTQPIAAAIGLGAAIDYIDSIGGSSAIHHHLDHLTDYALKQLGRVEDLTMYGPSDPTRRSSLVAFNLQSIHPHDLASLLDQDGIAVRSGHHCAQPLTDLLGVPATTRASFYIYNTSQDVDALVDSLKQVHKKFS